MLTNSGVFLIQLTMTEYRRLANIVGSLAISQFDGDQEAYQAVIRVIFDTFAFGDGEEGE